MNAEAPATVRVTLAGFGGDRPPVFHGGDTIDVAVGGDGTVADALAAAGLADGEGLSVLVDDSPVPARDRSTVRLRDGQGLVVLSALEGG